MNIWDRILDSLEGKVNPQSFTTWLRPTTLARDEGKKIYVTVPSELFANWLARNYMDLIQASATSLEREGSEIAFVFDEHAPAFPSAVAPAAAPKPTLPGPSLHARYTFDTFVVSSSNEMAHAASLRVAEQPSLAYNPLYIYGGVGLGKREEATWQVDGDQSEEGRRPVQPAERLGHGSGNDSRFSKPPSARRTTRAYWESSRSNWSIPVQLSTVS